MKKFTALLMSLLMAFMLFAQTETESIPSVGLTDSDVKSFIKNFDKISAEFDKLSIQMDNADSVSQKDVDKVESILEKYGISGPSRILKFQAITYGSAYYVTEATLGEKYAQMIGSTYLVLVNEKDMKVIEKNKKELVKLYGDVEEMSDDDKEDLENALDFLSGSYSKELNSSKNSKSSSKNNKKDDKKSTKKTNPFANISSDDLANAFGLNSTEKKAFNFVSDKATSKKATNDTNLKSSSEQIEYVQSIEKKLSSSKKDVGFLYKKYDSKNASKYKKAKHQERVYDLFFEYPNHSPSENAAYFYFRYNNEWGDNPYATCRFSYFDSKGKLTDNKEIQVKILSFELYESDTGLEVIYQTEKFGTLHFWSDYGDENRNNVNSYFGNDGILIKGYKGESVA